LSATNYLRGLQQSDGGWEWIPGGFGSGTDTNSTALALQALVAAGESPTATAVISGLQYLKMAQNNDGGFPYDPDSPWGTDSDVNSTAYVVQAIYSAGQDPTTWTISATNPISYLLDLQLANGSFEWQPGTGANLFSTQQAIPALLGRFDPLTRKILTECPAFFLPLISK
jgi:prenyltransferase beta subunit